jgi:hypothetical protein
VYGEGSDPVWLLVLLNRSWRAEEATAKG